MVSPNSPSSFIPKSPTKSTVKPRGVRKIYVFTYLSLVLFFGTLIASAGTFFFDLTVKQNLEVQKEQLSNERNAFDARDLGRLRDLEQRIINAKNLLNTHVSVADIFDALEASTINTVQLTGIKYERTQFGGISIAVAAVTPSLNDARFQQSQYAANDILQKAGIVEPSFTTRTEQLESSETTLASQGVVFTLDGTLETTDIPYRSPSFEANNEALIDVSTSTETDFNSTNTDAFLEQTNVEEFSE